LKQLLEDWKDADRDVPVLVRAKAEYAGLKQSGFSGQNFSMDRIWISPGKQDPAFLAKLSTKNR
jgi:hypothetical protein